MGVSGRAARYLAGPMRTKNALSAAALTLLSAAAIMPASASAACARIPLDDQVRGSALVVTAEFLPGAADPSGVLQTPARARVRTYDQGKGAAELDVVTSLGARFFGAEGISPKAGEVWRLYGSLASNGSLGTSLCSGSLLLPASGPVVSVGSGAARKAPVTATTAGKPHSGALPVLKLPKSGRLTVKASSAAGAVDAVQAAAVRLIEPGRTARTLKVSWSGRSGALTGRLQKLALGRKGATLVVLTREASFALALRRSA